MSGSRRRTGKVSALDFPVSDTPRYKFTQRTDSFPAARLGRRFRLHHISYACYRSCQPQVLESDAGTRSLANPSNR